MRVSLLLFDDCVASIVAGVVDVWRMANRIAGRRTIDWHLRSVDGGTIRSSVGIAFETDEIDAADEWIVVPGLDHASIDGLLRGLAGQRRTIDVVRRRHAAGAGVASCCSGAFLLAEAGVLNARAATTSWWLGGELLRRVPSLQLHPDDMLVEDGRLITAGAVTACHALALRLVALGDSEALAERCASVMLVDRERSAQTRHTSAVIAQDARPASFALAEAWLELHLSDLALTVADLAKASFVSERTLHRAFRANVGTSPDAYLRRLRMRRARQLLESSRLPLTVVAERCGYSSASAFRRAFAREIGAAPGRYRAERTLVAAR